MKKTSILTLITALTLSISPLFAETLIKDTSQSDSTVDDIIAEIEQAKAAAKKLQAANIIQATDTQTSNQEAAKIVELKKPISEAKEEITIAQEKLEVQEKPELKEEITISQETEIGRASCRERV